MKGLELVHGNYPGHILRHSVITSLLARTPRPGELLTSVVNRLHSTGSANGSGSAQSSAVRTE